MTFLSWGLRFLRPAEFKVHLLIQVKGIWTWDLERQPREVLETGTAGSRRRESFRRVRPHPSPLTLELYSRGGGRNSRYCHYTLPSMAWQVRPQDDRRLAVEDIITHFMTNQSPDCGRGLGTVNILSPILLMRKVKSWHVWLYLPLSTLPKLCLPT